jgi:hypothetical protein
MDKFMTSKEQLLQEIDSASDRLIIETLDFLRLIKAKEQGNFFSTGQSLLAHLEKMGTWQGDDLDECLQGVVDSRLPAELEIQINPFKILDLGKTICGLRR